MGKESLKNVTSNMSPTKNLPECGIRPPQLLYYFCLWRGNLREAELMMNRNFPQLGSDGCGYYQPRISCHVDSFSFFFLFFFLLHQGKFLTIKSRNSKTYGYQKQTLQWSESWYKCSFTSISAPSLKLMVQIAAILPFKCLCSRNSSLKEFLDR